MHGKAADLVLEVNSLDVVLVLDGVHIQLVAAALHLGDSRDHLVGADSDVAVRALEHGLHDLNAGGGEVGGVALLDAEIKGIVEGVADLHCAVAARGVDADMGDLEAEEALSCVLAQCGYLLKVACRDIGLGADPASADSVDNGRGDELGQILSVYAAGRDELNAAEGTCQRLECAETAVDVCGEELENLEIVLESHHNLGRGHAARSDGYAVIAAPGDNLFVIAGGDDELCAALDGELALIESDDGACAYEHLGAFLGDRLNGVGSGGGAEGDLHNVDTAGEHGLCGGDGILSVLKDNHGDYAGLSQSF